jgi:hypothetical protein
MAGSVFGVHPPFTHLCGSYREPASARSLVLQTIGEAGRSHKSAFDGPWNRVLVLMESARVFTS